MDNLNKFFMIQDNTSDFEISKTVFRFNWSWTVQVPGGGGGTPKSFGLSPEMFIMMWVTLRSNTNMRPYATLTLPDGSDVNPDGKPYQPGDRYFIPEETAEGGVNTGHLMITEAGLHTLTVFDGNNNGGDVVIEVLVRLNPNGLSIISQHIC